MFTHFYLYLSVRKVEQTFFSLFIDIVIYFVFTDMKYIMFLFILRKHFHFKNLTVDETSWSSLDFGQPDFGQPIDDCIRFFIQCKYYNCKFMIDGFMSPTSNANQFVWYCYFC